MVLFKIIAFDLLVIRHCRVNCSSSLQDGYLATKHTVLSTSLSCTTALFETTSRCVVTTSVQEKIKSLAFYNSGERCFG